jgi:hypothetical protein
MEFQVKFDINDKIFIKNPENSEIGKQIVKTAIDLIFELGFEHFTFKKLAVEINSTEATIYRYFENKHRLLLYILNWYWSYMEFLVDIKLENINEPKEKVSVIVHLLTHELPLSNSQLEYNKNYLNQIVISESSKVYLVKEVEKINQEQVFKPYKDLCTKIADSISEYNPKYPFPRSLSTTLIETSHQQQYFIKNLPRLTDYNKKVKIDFIHSFLTDLVFKVLK